MHGDTPLHGPGTVCLLRIRSEVVRVNFIVLCHGVVSAVNSQIMIKSSFKLIDSIKYGTETPNNSLVQVHARELVHHAQCVPAGCPVVH